jgi:hypothetical protein
MGILFLPSIENTCQSLIFIQISKIMNATIGVYDNHDLAVAAIQRLKDAGYPVNQMSIMGLMETEVVDEKMHVMPKSSVKAGGLGAGTVLGTTLGILTGVGMFAIPGVGFLYGAGALVGAIAGFDIGLIGGGIASALVSVGVKDDMAKKYHDDLVAGKYLVIAHGSEAHVNEAKDLLHEHGTHEEITSH